MEEGGRAVDLRCGGMRAPAQPGPTRLHTSDQPPLLTKDCNVNVCGYRSIQYICFNTNHQGVHKGQIYK